MVCERKLLESEATTGFFALLGEQGNKAVLDWVMKEGLIPSRYEFPKCKKDMHSVERNDTIDGFEWRCRVQSKEKPHFACRSADQIKINDSVTLQNSVFNYIVTGGLPAADDKHQCLLLSEQEGLEDLISKFWQLESIEDEPRNLNSQAKFCEEHFVNNHWRDESGQYIVQMAFLKEPSCLGESKQMAIRRLNSLWRKLDVNPNLKQLY
ncbi:integrase catalytic domain-containing protein [Trichonephila clavipes]|nr:integrase catalytic domain-containing protein [Trichonephila clavipes]